MSKILMLKGLPASGKSTYAKELVARGGWKRVNKDDLRAMFDSSKWSKGNEKFVIRVRNAIVTEAVSSGQYSVVVDDTNFAPRHEATLREIADQYKIPFEIKFFDTALDECIERDLRRPNSVGEKVIRDMYEQFLAPPPVVYRPPEGMPPAILCDIDGTLARMVDRGPYDWSKVGNDVLDDAVAGILSRYSDMHIIIMSGRDSACRDETAQWLKKHNIRYSSLYMRPEGDSRKDSVVKKELFEKYIKRNYQIEFVLDDRNQVVDMWRNELGLKVFQVERGDF